MFDTVCKFLVETFSIDFATWLLGEPVTLTELSPSELSLEPIRADALILLQSEETILHIEFQSRPDPDMAFRMVDYRLRVYRRFPKKSMRQVVIYLQPSQSEAVYQTTFDIPGTRHEFEVIRLWEQPSSRFLNTPGLLPFTVLTATEDRAELLRQVAYQIDTLPQGRLQSNVTASTAILAGLLLDKDLIQRVLRKEMMQESVIYQEIKAEGRQEGRQEGIEEGRQEGIEEGRQEGIEEGIRNGEVMLVRRLLMRRIGRLPEMLGNQINELSLGQLGGLGEALLDFSELADLEVWLSELQQALLQVLEEVQMRFGELSADMKVEVQALPLDQAVGLKDELGNWSDMSQLQVWLDQQKAKEESLENSF